MDNTLSPDTLINVLTFVFYLGFIAYAVIKAKHILTVGWIIFSLLVVFSIIVIYDNAIFGVSLSKILRGENWNIWIVYGGLIGICVGGIVKLIAKTFHLSK